MVYAYSTVHTHTDCKWIRWCQQMCLIQCYIPKQNYFKQSVFMFFLFSFQFQNLFHQLLAAKKRFSFSNSFEEVSETLADITDENKSKPNRVAAVKIKKKIDNVLICLRSVRSSRQQRDKNCIFFLSCEVFELESERFYGHFS